MKNILLTILTDYPCVQAIRILRIHLRTIIIALITSKGREGYSTRVKTLVNEITGWIVLDQIRAIDKTRLRHKIGDLGIKGISEVKNIIKEMLVD
jgi:mRNA interferase MazF